MAQSIPGPVGSPTQPGDPLPYLRGLQQLITQQRLEYLLARTSRRRSRQRRIVASHSVWLVIAMSLFSTHSIPQVWRLLHPTQDRHEPDESAFTKARKRLGVTVMRMLFEEFAATLAPPGTRGVFHRGWRLMAIDGTTFNLPDTPANATVFGRGHNQVSKYPYPQVRVLALCEVGTHAVCDVAFRPYCSSEQDMVPHLLRSLQPGMLLLWDRGFFGFKLITSVLDRGCHLLARVKTSQLIFERRETLSDGSYLTKIYRSTYDRAHDRNGRVVRLIEYTIDDPKRKGHGEKHRLLTDILDPAELPALESATLYHERWESELVFDEIKTHLNGREVPVRSKTPRGVIQELYGLFLAHRIVRQVMLDAAAEAELDPDRLSFTNTLRILQAQLPEASSVSPSEWYEQLVEEASRQRLRPRRNRCYPRVVKRKTKKWNKKQPRHLKPPQPTKTFAESVVIT